MRCFGPVVPVVCFALATRAAVERFLGTCTLVHEATSFGGGRRRRSDGRVWGGDAIAEGFIRLSVGCEDAEGAAAMAT
jgi:cystathionine gamma-lyase